MLHLRGSNSEKMLRHPFWAASSQLLDVTASRAKTRQRKRREGLARGSAEDAAEGMACCAGRARSDTDSGSSRAWKGTTKVATFATGTAARTGVPVRQGSSRIR